ncbi:pre-mRNA-processing factor 17 isoform X1 [Parasteatoda tepidariorum]|uniref:pre-mRNA-processing factor 17 isoform X2 n=1 Tax=Parasteatoda tepidariorum TaxID=114398 RepID=UPI001C728DDA|nr:pre-mRNA-processing factor 17 isoform X1 [Parasteatoda tepidariorum]XP_042911146.1 pre-mRNA-processing factor 17 isoform X2 [Parasteatoda tepidariorum]
MASIALLKGYGSDSDQSIDEALDNENNIDFSKSIVALKDKFQINAAPLVEVKESFNAVKCIDPTNRVLTYNPKFEELYAPVAGPENPFKTQQQKADKNTLSGFVEEAHINDFHFESQRRTFTSFGYAIDPSLNNAEVTKDKLVANESNKTLADTSVDDKVTVFDKTKAREGDKRKRVKNADAADIDGFLGPWGGYVNEKRVLKPSEEEQEELDEILAKRQKRGKVTEDKTMEEKSILHIKDAYDYQGRSFLHVPQDVGVNLKSDDPPEKCFIPKKLLHTWTAHSKGISTIKFFPKTAHLLLSCSMDCRVKLFEVYNERRCIRSYLGHKQAVRDICFNNNGTQFLSAGYDRYVKLWDTETGKCLGQFSNRKIPYCVKFNPDDDKQHLFVAGTSDKKIVCWDINSNEVVQEYDRHLGAVNTITFVDENRRFVSTSDDKSLRVWEWDIPVDMKYIADPTMHSMPAVTLSPNGKWLACQSMDNKIMVFSALNRFKLNRKKTFTGHMVAGYACGLDFAPDMSYIVSGDADGKVYIWDWKTTKLFSKFKAHDNVCSTVIWHPHETSKVISAGWDGTMKLWD